MIVNRCDSAAHRPNCNNRQAHRTLKYKLHLSQSKKVFYRGNGSGAKTSVWDAALITGSPAGYLD
jgi:hypothetical protein